MDTSGLSTSTKHTDHTVDEICETECSRTSQQLYLFDCPTSPLDSRLTSQQEHS